MTRWVAISALALLLLVLLAVVMLLPELVAERDSLPAPQPPRVTAPPARALPPATPDDGTATRARLDAERKLNDVLARQSVLESENVAAWGGADYESVLRLIALGDAALGESRYADAAKHYGDAVAGLEALALGKDARLEGLLADGAEALQAGDGEGARRWYAMALALAPADPRAGQGLARARVVEALASALAEGAAFEAAGDLEHAREAFHAAVELDGASPPARDAHARVIAAIADRDFHAAMSAALPALERGELSAAAKSLAAARAIEPDSPQVRDLATRLETATQTRRIAAHRDRAGTLEAQERWSEAQAEYRAVLAIDPRAAFAQDGLARSGERARIHAELDRFLAAGERLSDPEPRARAQQLLAVARAVGSAGQPRLAEKTAALDAQVTRAGTPVRVELRSDDLTDVVVYRVGRLGRFEHRVLDLPPGQYVVVGSRAGYRDVRVEFSLAPGEAGASVRVRCEEKI